MPAPKPPFMRFLDSIRKDTGNGCWLWTGNKGHNGYGSIKVFGKMVSTHRFSYELHKGPIPDGMHILHSCDVKLCVNPDHLRLGDHAQNMKEAGERGLMASGDRHPMSGVKNPRPKQANRVLVLGVEYESQKSAERALGLGSGTVRYWIKSGSGKATILEKGASNC